MACDKTYLCDSCRNCETEQTVKYAHLVEKEVCVYNIVKFPRAEQCGAYEKAWERK